MWIRRAGLGLHGEARAAVAGLHLKDGIHACIRPGDGQQRLTTGLDTEQVRGHYPGLRSLPASPQMLTEVAVETASSSGNSTVDGSGPGR